MDLPLTYPIIACIALGLATMAAFVQRNPSNEMLFALVAAFLPTAYFFPHPDIDMARQLIGAVTVFGLGALAFVTGFLRAGGVLKAIAAIALWVPITHYLNAAVTLFVGGAIYVIAYAAVMKAVGRDTSRVPQYASVLLLLAIGFVGVSLGLDMSDESVIAELRQ